MAKVLFSCRRSRDLLALNAGEIFIGVSVVWCSDVLTGATTNEAIVPIYVSRAQAGEVSSPV